MATITRSSSSRRKPASQKSAKRLDIQGIRALAVLLVVIYHAGVTQLEGGYVGVDVFFVISGFLITGQLVRELTTDRSISLKGFYARRAKRLLPASTVVLAFVAVMSMLFLPLTRAVAVSWDIVGSAFYWMNWRLSVTSTDYLNQGSAPSPVQHFWSLAVEEQYYIVWPLLLLGFTYGARQRNKRRRGEASLRWPLIAAVATISIPSLLWSMYLTNADAGAAYFVTTTRMWELGIGSALALTATLYARIPQIAAAIMGWAGIAAIVFAAATYDSGTPFPGTAALIPTVGTAAVIAAGLSAGKAGPVAVLGLKPMTWLGDISYSLYLWHWPLLVLAATIWDDISVPFGLAIVAVSIIPAWLSYYYVEQFEKRNWFKFGSRRSKRVERGPIRLDTGNSLYLGVFCMTLAAIIGLTLQLVKPGPPPAWVSLAYQPSSAQENAAPFGAQVLAANPAGDQAGAPVDRVDSISPSPAGAKTSDFDCTVSLDDSAVESCTLGDRNSKTVIALVGDSHAAHWAPALAQIAVDNGWKVVTYTKALCAFADVTQVEKGSANASAACTEWNKNVATALATGPKPALMVVSNIDRPLTINGTQLGQSASSIALSEGLQRSWQPMVDKGVPILAIGHTPWPNVDIPDCVALNMETLTKCAIPREDTMTSSGPSLELAVKATPGAQLIDLFDAVCPTDVCAPVIGGTLVYRDNNHMTAEYARSLAPRLEGPVKAAIGAP